nr:phosphate-starvation-inducible PsiE family protein [Sulfuriferula plumbiphila]
MTLYERFEQGVALILTGLIAAIIMVALLELSKEVFQLVLVDAANPLDHTLFQALFGQILTVLIALEFKHSILKVVARKESIIQVKTVLLIGLLAISRKFIVLDIGEIQADTILALAAAVVALAIAYWLIRERENSRAR